MLCAIFLKYANFIVQNFFFCCFIGGFSTVEKKRAPWSCFSGLNGESHLIKHDVQF